MKILSLRGEWGRVRGGPLDDYEPAEILEPAQPARSEGEGPQRNVITVTDWILVQVQTHKDSDES
jgi:hypothetical protein